MNRAGEDRSVRAGTGPPQTSRSHRGHDRQGTRSPAAHDDGSHGCAGHRRLNPVAAPCPGLEAGPGRQPELNGPGPSAHAYGSARDTRGMSEAPEAGNGSVANQAEPPCRRSGLGSYSSEYSNVMDREQFRGTSSDR